MKLDIPFLLRNLTLEEKAGLCSGRNFWWTKAVERLGLPTVMVSDGPHGLRKQDSEGDHLGMSESVEAVCFPTGAALAASFDRELTGRLGRLIGREGRAEKLHTVLGPAINIKRSPLCGRNFEYLSEDPFLAGELSAAFVSEVQSQNVGVCVKHYAANNQEYRRMSTDTVVSERALREIYLAAFEKTVKEARPWSLMCAYNLINGTYCCENSWLLDDVLRKEWGFDGIVMTDWGAMNDRVRSLRAGLNLEMPSSRGHNDKKIVAAVEQGELEIAELDRRVEELLHWIEKGLSDEPAVSGYDREAHHAVAREAAAECAVLLKNDNGLLPLSKTADVVFIGSFAASPRYQGGGSSYINAFKVSNAVEAAKGTADITYEPGWQPDGETGDPSLLDKAVKSASKAAAAVVFAGLPDSYESEGYDRTHLNMPACQNELIAAVCAVQPNTIVVLHTGSPVVMPWLDKVPAILNMYLGGQAVGEASVDLLFGDSAPAGRLAETFPHRLEDTPCYLNFPGDGRKVTYAEDVFVGYRWYDSRSMDVTFPFGFGLSYTDFSICNPKLSSDSFDGTGTLNITVNVTNIGPCAGKHVVQLYVAPPVDGKTPRPAHELRGFEKVELAPGETKCVSFLLDKRSFAYFEESIGDWRIESGVYTIQLGSSSRDLPLSATVQVRGSALPLLWSESLTVGDIIAAGRSDALGSALDRMQQVFGAKAASRNFAGSQGMFDALADGLPVHSMASFIDVEYDFEEAIRRNLENNL